MEVSSEIVNLIETLNMEPILSVLYSRECLHDKEAGIRITFDSEICFKALNNHLIRPQVNQALGPRDKVIMEIKASKARPEWLKRLIRESGLKRARFSKYCHGVELLYPDELDQSHQTIKTGLKSDKGVPEYARVHDEFAELFPVSRFCRVL